ncbi:hypothetical protein A2348_02450 [Candidatus Uhrbacteria bacterium RIFOXYB12_FULL_58_10]|uniref:ribose-phosphate diphosphokinase n=1 Tax=Candidatus Uhrbacteria bacterium RIFOXYB2_FULL_57_15 TaxID=1802422 RepID=A0A1F7W5U6_9BACT|nr:MAG: hypothetical protein A2348_02450 [Candidatus Uhrbacteria bacterium RIFOXYB12_FULL_58_10]OGL98185.1 MAG: hypothetical protein A2304_03680 [Candidatus Uhrbacteria bacterium RIFOXYB2_FULL_57_15]OGL99325.1 MAG: hypothetical protein A2501_05285 [Candidatus Uhrbacteria bacterium RIFOXYC12_FULL_57_11]
MHPDMIHFLARSTKHLRPLFVNRQAGVGAFDIDSSPEREWNIRINEDVKRKQVTLVGSILPDPNSLFEILTAFRVLRENKSLNPFLVVPYLAYARQDHIAKPGEAAIGIMIAETLRNLNPSSLFVLDVHSRSVIDALGPNAVELSALPLFARTLLDDEPVDVIVAPDQGATGRAKRLAELVGAEVAVIEKIHPKPNVTQAKSISRDISGKHVVIVDDLIDTGGTIIEAVRLVSKRGASSIRVAATHGLFSNDAREKLAALPIRRLYVTNSIAQERHPNITVLDITPMLLSL